MVKTSGLEPPTPCMSSKYSNQLSYAFISYRCNYYNRFARVCKESFCLFILSCNGIRLVLATAYALCYTEISVGGHCLHRKLERSK